MSDLQDLCDLIHTCYRKSTKSGTIKLMLTPYMRGTYSFNLGFKEGELECNEHLDSWMEDYLNEYNCECVLNHIKWFIKDWHDGTLTLDSCKGSGDNLIMEIFLTEEW